MNPLEQGGEPVAQRLAAGLTKIGLAIRNRCWKQAAGSGLTPTQGQILVVLGLRRQPSTLAEVAGALGITAPTASDALQALRRKRLVRTARSRTDGRSLALSLTVKGRRQADRCAGWPNFLAEAVEVLSPAEQQALLRAVIQIIKTLQDRRAIPVSRMCVTCRYFRPNVHSDSERPHHCDYVNAPFGERLLRLECPDHEPAARDVEARNWERFLLAGKPISSQEGSVL